MAEPTSSSSQSTGAVVCPATKDPSVRLFIVAGFAIFFGLYCDHDAFVLKKYSTDSSNYVFNATMGIVLPPLGLIPLVYGILMMRRRFVADNEGLGYLGKRKVRWDQLTRMVPRGKGLLDVHYTVDGEEDLFKLDSWKIQNFAELVNFIEAKTPEVPRESANAKE